MSELAGKVALITGGGRGQGRSHALKLAEAGADIAICDIVEQDAVVPYPTGRSGDLEETARLVEELDRRCVARVVDVRDHAAVSRFTAAVVEELGALDILVAQAGNCAPSTIQEMSEEQWQTVIDVCLTGVFNAIRAAAPIMVAQESGRIIATASGQARMGAPNMGNYIAAKWGVIGLIKTAAWELGPHNITANAICPGVMGTPMMRNEVMRKLFNPELEDPTDADIDRKVIELGMHKLPVGMLDAAETSHAVVFLASDKARYISGTTIDVNAGWSATHA
jgi:SDR family mycofactocin-dependent oxidoreductase